MLYYVTSNGSAMPSSAHGCSGHFASTHSVHVRCHLPSRGQATLPFTSIYHRLLPGPRSCRRQITDQATLPFTSIYHRLHDTPPRYSPISTCSWTFSLRRHLSSSVPLAGVPGRRPQTKPPFRSLPSIIGCMTPPKVQSDINLFLDIFTATPSVIVRAIGRSARPSSAHGCSGHFGSTHSVHVRCHLPSRGQATLPFTSIYHRLLPGPRSCRRQITDQATLPFTSIYHRLHDTPQGTVRYQLVPGHFHCLVVQAILHQHTLFTFDAISHQGAKPPFRSLRSIIGCCQAPAVAADKSQTKPPFRSLRSIIGCCQAPAVAADKSQTKPPFRSLRSIIGCMTPPKVQSDINLFLDIFTATPSVIVRAIGRSRDIGSTNMYPTPARYFHVYSPRHSGECVPTCIDKIILRMTIHICLHVCLLSLNQRR